MYLDFSIRKMFLLGTILLVLFSFVYATDLFKRKTFGTTPYFYAISTGSEYALRSIIAQMSRSGGNAFAAAAAAFGRPSIGVPSSDQKPAPAIPALTYHRVLDSDDPNNVTLKVFRDQMMTLHRAGWRAVSLEDFERFMRGESELPEKSFLLTFDDGAKDSFYPVDPILRSLGWDAAIYIIAQSSKTDESTYYLTHEEIRWLLSTGRWSIGSHSFDGHRPYGVAPDGSTGIFFADRIWKHDAARLETSEEFTVRVRDDLTRSRDSLASDYGVNINTFAFPLGNETGIEGANNFPEGASITEREARNLYEFGFLQTNGQTYTFNFPVKPTAAFTPAFASTTDALSTNFLVRRIHVDHDWSGDRLLSIMENGRAKSLPFEDDFSSQKGWISAWGALDIGRNNLRLEAEPSITSASAFLDGSALWDNYSFDVAVNWQKGYALILADVLDSRTYHSCAFSPGTVRIQRTIHGETTTLAQKNDARISYGDARLGIRVHGSVIECAWNFESLVEDYSRNFSGGVGVQTWDPAVGAAELTVSSIIVRPYTSE